MDKSKIFYDFSSLIFNYLKETSQNLSLKIMEIFKIIISITPIVIGIGYYLLQIIPSPFALSLFNISVIFFLVTLIYGINILPASKFKLTEPLAFYMKYFDSDSSDILEQIAVQIGDDCRELNLALHAKSVKLKNLITLFTITLLFLFAAYISLFIDC